MPKNNFSMVSFTPLGRLLMVQKELRCRTGNCFFDPKKHFGTTLVFPCYTATKPHWTHVNGQEEHTHKSSSSPVGEIPLISSTSKRIHTKKLLPDGPSHSYGTSLQFTCLARFSKLNSTRKTFTTNTSTRRQKKSTGPNPQPNTHMDRNAAREHPPTNRAECLSERCP